MTFARWFAAAAASFVGAAAALSAAVPVQASDASVLQAKVRAALRSAKSFVQTVTIKPNLTALEGGTIVYTVVAPHRFRQTATGFPGGSDDTIIIGNQVYGNKGSGWDVQTWSDRLVTGFEGEVFDVTVVSAGADRTVDGKVVGSFVIKDPGSEKPTDTLACTYDKQTFRPFACSGAAAAVTFTHFNDPANAIPTPTNAKRLDG